MAEKIVVDLEVNSNLEPTIANLKELKKQLKQTAAGSEDFKKLYNQIDDLEDKIKSAKQGSSDWVDSLESAGGPLGSLGKGLNSAKVATVSFGTALKATGIGLIVAAVGGLVAAFTQSETAMKKLQPLFIAFEKILGGIFKAFEPVLDAFIELATQALPYITKGIGMFYSGLYSLFTLVKNVGVSAGQLLKGIFTLDFDALKEGAAGIKDAFTGISKTFEETYKRFEEGTNEQTKTERENAEERAKNAKEARDKAAAEAEKLRQENLKKAESANAVELEAFKATLTERERLEFEAGLKLAEQRKVLEAAGRTDMTAIEEQYRITLAEVKKKFDDEEAKVKEEKDKKDAENLKKKLEDERGIILTNLQAKFEDLDRENARIDFDFQADLQRLQQQKDILAEQERTELANTELTEFQKTEVRKKYADARKGISDQEIATEKAAAEAKQAINMAYLGLFEQFGNVLGQVAGKNKALAIAGIVISQAAAIGQIIAQTSIANAKSVAASPLTFGMPWVAINTISAGLSIASTIASAVKSIQGINSAAASAGVSGGGGGGQVMAAPTLPKVAGMAAPQIQTGGGQSSSSQIAQTLAMAQSSPTRAYVVSQDISSNQALDRRTNRAATFTGS
jgi:chemotaxis protein histidine kinase CheA